MAEGGVDRAPHLLRKLDDQPDARLTGNETHGYDRCRQEQPHLIPFAIGKALREKKADAKHRRTQNGDGSGAT